MMPLPGWPVMAPNAYDNNNPGNNSIDAIARYPVQALGKQRASLFGHVVRLIDWLSKA